MKYIEAHKEKLGFILPDDILELEGYQSIRLYGAVITLLSISQRTKWMFG